MKVALVRYRYSPHGGAERYMDTLSAALSDAGAEVYRAGDGVHAEWLLRKRSLRPGSWPLDYLRPLNLAYLHLERAMFDAPALRLVIANSNLGREEIASLRFSPITVTINRYQYFHSRFLHR